MMQKKLHPFPTRNEMLLGGITMLLSHTLFAVGTGLVAQFYNAYNVDNEMDVIELHEILSSNKYRIRVEICCGLIWFSFPLLLMQSYVMTKLTKSVNEGYGEIFSWLFEKGYLMWIYILCIIIPAILLSTLSIFRYIDMYIYSEIICLD